MSISEIASRLAGWPQRVLAVACLLLAIASAIGARRGHNETPGGSPVVVAAHDLAAGARLSGSDVRVRTWPRDIRPPNAESRSAQVIGRRLAAPIRAGEALTSSRLAAPNLASGLPPTMQAIPVTVTGAGLPSLIHVGDTIDLLVHDPPAAEELSAPSARVLAEGLRVLAVAAPSHDLGVEGEGTGLIVAADRQAALQIAAASGSSVVATVRNPP